ncbi:monooxygenase [Aspergillus heteromorphus CBS 117.55]|uniref:Monooxygenase n=1 Tax=Aspergillus heteromorphus CBS 117.55 TaxID=1448321 RepID=A0A317WQ50_9EURO|nr:monooxygenase [Aspergillus heteromorphus CBS 117.55]PWY88175.1 monooxygenase [Aspergillus heteromorphus CBS 117.55]
MSTAQSKFRVVIVGGSIAGLTLAHCLWRNNIDFVVLEAYREIAPQVGASIGIFANGARILDQLGMFDDLLSAVEPLQYGSYWNDNGDLIMSAETHKLLQERHGYPINFLDRQTVLEILYAHLEDCREKVLVSKKVTRVEHYPTHIVAHCQDGSSYEGDLIVGADGVHSTVRQLMWNYMETRGLSREVERERRRMTSEYSCVFGISTQTAGLIPGHSHRTYAEGYSFLVIVGKEGRVYWFLFTKMDRQYASHEIPRFKKENVDEYVAPWLRKPVTRSIAFEEVYKRAIVKTHLPLEEANYEYWCKDRWVIIGDSSHKMTPNAGQGGNSAIESAVTLANSLAKLLQSKHSIQIDDVDLCLQAWQKSRKPRLTKIWNSARDLTRLEACETFKHKLISLHLLPYLRAMLLDKASADIIGAEKLDCLPLPPRSLLATMPYINEAEFENQRGCSWKRGLWCIPFLGCLGAARATMTPLIAGVGPFMVDLFAQGVWTARNGERLSLQQPLYPIPFLDKLLKPMVTCFLPSISGTDPVSSIQMRSFITDLGAVYGIWMLESYRDANSPIEVLLPMLTGCALQLKGAGLWAPIYYALEYFQVSFPQLLSHGRHEVKANRTISLVIAMLAGYYFPTYQSFTASTIDSRRWWNSVWQLFPVVVPALAGTISWLAGKPQPKTDLIKSKEERSKKNMAFTRATYIGFAAISGLTWIHGLRSAPSDSSVLSIFWPGLSGQPSPVTSFMGGIARFLQYDQIISMTSGFIWLGLRLGELKQCGASFSWWQVASAFVGTTAAFGPGAAFALGWGWKEELMNTLSL